MNIYASYVTHSDNAKAGVTPSALGIHHILTPHPYCHSIHAIFFRSSESSKYWGQSGSEIAIVRTGVVRYLRGGDGQSGISRAAKVRIWICNIQTCSSLFFTEPLSEDMWKAISKSSLGQSLDL